MPKQTDIRKILLIGWAFLGEPLSPARAAGALLVGGEIYVVSSSSSPSGTSSLGEKGVTCGSRR